MEMLLMGEAIDAARALSIGLVTRVVAPEELLPRCAEWRRISRRSHLSFPAP